MGRAERLYHRSHGEPLSQGRSENSPKKEGPPIDFVIAATSSARRKSLIQHVFDLPVHMLSLGEGEPITPFTQRVVQEKLRRARLELERNRYTGTIPQGPTALVAADTQSGTLAINKKGIPILKYQSKPQSPKDVMRVFQELAEVSSFGENPYYTVISSSGVGFEPRRRPDIIMADPMMTVLHLDPALIQNYSTIEGFEEYQADFDALYSSSIYTNNGELSPVTLTSMAAGLSIPVLTRRGAIVRINDVERNSKDFPNELRNAISIAGAGIDPVVLDAIRPGASERLMTWPFLQRLEDYALGNSTPVRPMTVFQSSLN